MIETSKMQRYECHKKVWALEIERVGSYRTGDDGRLVRDVTFTNGETRALLDKVFLRTTPEPGWFYVVYDDGYESFLPRQAFVEGYKLIDERTFRDIRAGTNLRDGPAGTNG